MFNAKEANQKSKDSTKHMIESAINRASGKGLYETWVDLSHTGPEVRSSMLAYLESAGYVTYITSKEMLHVSWRGVE